LSKVFIVGSNSFSGASFVDALTQQGQDVTGCGRSPDPHPASRAPALEGSPQAPKGLTTTGFACALKRKT